MVNFPLSKSVSVFITILLLKTDRFRLIDNLGWQGAFLVTAAIVLSSVVFGGLFRPLENLANK